MDEFTVLAVWDSLGANVFDHLGFHDCDCVVSVEETRSAQLKAFPNPFNDRLDLMTGQPMVAVVVRTLSGTEAMRLPVQGRNTVRLDLATLPTGAYLVEVTLADGTVERRQAVKH